MEGMVADETPNVPSPFDVRTIENLVALMTGNDLNEIDLREGDLRIRLRRGGSGLLTTSLPVNVPVAQATPPSASQPEPKDSKQARALHEIKSPVVGTFYASPNPGAETFVKVGSRVTPATVVGIIEAMKIFNEITADCTGIITEVLVENQQAVEFGQVLFRVDPAG